MVRRSHHDSFRGTLRDVSGRHWISAVVAGLALLVAGFFVWPHRRSAVDVPTAKSSTSQAGDRPSPLAKAPGPTSGPLPNEHAVPLAAPDPPAEQSPQSLAVMIQGLRKQSSASMVRVLNVKHEGGCSHGTLVFELDDFRFECVGSARETFRIARSEVGKVHKNGVQVWKSGRAGKLGRRYHFSMVGRSKDLVEGAFAEWMRLTLEPAVGEAHDGGSL